ncbi:MAG: glycosyl hydrolase family 18 protein, partial [Pseudomonadota bacterium]
AGPVAPLDGAVSVRASIQTWLKAGIAPAKLLLGVPYYGYDWPTRDDTQGSATTGSGRSVPYENAQADAAQYGRNWDPASSSPWYAYSTESGWRQAWYEDAQSLGAKYSVVNAENLGGVALWALSYDGSRRELWDALKLAFTTEPGGAPKL